jgi:hypothetical protein
LSKLEISEELIAEANTSEEDSALATPTATTAGMTAGPSAVAYSAATMAGK